MKAPAPNGRRHGLRAKAPAERQSKTTVVFEKRSQVYCWSTDSARSRYVHKH